MGQKFRDRLLSQLLARASYQLSKEFLLAVARRGFTARQWRLLGTLWDEKNLTLTDLGEAILCSQSTTTRLVERLVQLGLVGKQGDTADRRRFQVFITEKGRREIKDLIDKALKVEEETTKLIGVGRVNALKAELRAVIETAKRASELLRLTSARDVPISWERSTRRVRSCAPASHSQRIEKAPPGGRRRVARESISSAARRRG